MQILGLILRQKSILDKEIYIMTNKLVSAIASKQLETNRVRVTRWDFLPFTETGWHVHEFDYIVVPIISGELTITDPSGSVLTFQIKEGISYNRKAGVEHNVQNLTKLETSFLEIEFKNGIE